MSGINLGSQFGSKFEIQHEDGGQDKYWSTNTTYDDLLMAHGQHVKDFADLTYLAKGMTYNRLGINMSKSLNPLYEFVTGSGGTEVVDKNWARWKIYGEPDRRAMSFGNVNEQSYIGTAGMPFTFFTDVDWFKLGDVLAPIRQKRAQIVIQSERAVPLDGGYKYDAVLLEDNDGAFLPEEYLAAGEYWIKQGAVASWEKFGQSGSIQFGEGFSYIEFQVPLTTMSWTFEIDGEAHRQWGNLTLSRCDDYKQPLPGGTKITNYMEMKANAQIEMEKEYFLSYGSQSEHLLDKVTGKQITTGPGLFEFLEEGNVIPYSPEVNNIDFIVEQIEAMWFNRVPSDQRELLLLTGDFGLKLFSEWVNNKFGNTAAIYNYDFVLKTRTAYDAKHGRDGYAFVAPQFTEYVLPTFGTIKVARWELLNNTRINGVNYPGTFYPVDSAKFVAFDIGWGEPNVKFLSRVDNKISTYVPGLWSPFGATGQDNPVFKSPAYMDESYRWIHRESFGVVVIDPARSLMFTPNVSY